MKIVYTKCLHTESEILWYSNSPSLTNTCNTPIKSNQWCRTLEWNTNLCNAKSARRASWPRMFTTPSERAELWRIAISPFQNLPFRKDSTVWLIGRQQWFLKKNWNRWLRPCRSTTVTSQVWMWGWIWPPRMPFKNANLRDPLSWIITFTNFGRKSPAR